MTEQDIVLLLGKYGDHRQRYELMIPNCYTQHDNEADFFAIRKSGLCDEFEIKVSRSDLLADKKKIVRYRDWDSASGSKPSEWYEWEQSPESKTAELRPIEKYKMEALMEGDMTANYFWYVLLEGIGDEKDIPPFAGLIIVKADGDLKIKRHPQKLKKEKLSVDEKYLIARKIQYRYWDMKTKSAA